MNTKSAGGIDGISTLFLKKFWKFFRVPLFKYMQHVFETGNLTQSFNSAVIRLIPKKGDTKQLKNWRPISLLNCIYKIVSKALDARLQKINEIILSRAQKGFTSNRNLQECLINILDTIAYAENEGIPGYVLALDMAKAFDTVRHDFTTMVYKHFRFGDNLIRMLNTISTKRSAAILREDGSPTTSFQLGTGFAQGNAPSPNQFNICEQIFIFKCEFDPAIKCIKPFNQIGRLPYGLPAPVPGPAPAPVPVPALVPVPVPEGVPAAAALQIEQIVQPRVFGSLESHYESANVEAFADDNNLLACLDMESITAVKNNLLQFAQISGLKCNVDKSQILLIGSDADPPEFLTNSGFEISNKLKILGYEVTKNFTDMENNFDKTRLLTN
jgi:hypothetical protein